MKRMCIRLCLLISLAIATVTLAPSALAAEGFALHLWQTTPGGNWTAVSGFALLGVLPPGGNWGNWSATGGFGAVGWQQMAVASNADGRLELFGLVGGDVYHLWQTTPGGSWSSASRFGAVGW